MVLVTSGSRLLRMFSAIARITSRPVARSWLKGIPPCGLYAARRATVSRVYPAGIGGRGGGRPLYRSQSSSWTRSSVAASRYLTITGV